MMKNVWIQGGGLRKIQRSKGQKGRYGSEGG